MKKILALFIVILGVSFFFSCNPDCQNFGRISASVTPAMGQAEKSLFLTLSVPNFLDERALYTERAVNGELIVNESTKVNTTPFDGGYLILVSEVGEGNYNFYVSDNDCGGFIPINAIFECESLAGIRADVTPSIRKAGRQVKVTTSPSSFLADKQLYIRSGTSNKMLESNFIAAIGGRIATLPMDVVGNAEIFIKDEACGGFVPISSVRVADQAFIQGNPGLFITPTPPNILIPPPSIVPPTNIVNTWFSPDNRNYCIWFFPDGELVNKNGVTMYKESSQLKTGSNINLNLGQDFTNLNTLDFNALGSFELPFSCPGGDVDPDLYTGNPVSGVINKETGFVSFVVDRSAKKDASGNSLGLEHYEGNIIETSTLPGYAQRVTDNCEESETKAETIMLVTSKETGKQMILFRQFLGLGIADNLLCE